MPYGDEKHQRIFNELINVLGEDYVEDDPAVMEAWYRDALTPSYVCTGRAEFITLPGSTEDVQNIVRMANRYEFPISMAGNCQAMNTVNAVAGHNYWAFMDPKRLNSIEIDADNMYAVVGAYVTIAQLQAEAMKFGLFHGVTGASTQATVVGTNMFQSIHWTGWRTGVGRNILGLEWVLPNGDVMGTGSLACGAGWFWGEGPGPDSRGILRGHMSHVGTLGFTTRMAVKLHPWPGPKVWPTEGVQPEKTVPLPKDIFKTYIVHFPTLEKVVDAISALGRAEICGYVMKYNAWDFVCWYGKSFEDFWSEWNLPFWEKMRKERYMLAVGLWGFAGPSQTKYEEKVLRAIVKELDGEFAPKEIEDKLYGFLTANTVRDTHRSRFTRLGRAGLTGCTMDSLYDALRSGPIDVKIKESHTPPLGYVGEDFKFWIFDFGHAAWTEMDSIAEKSSAYEELLGKIGLEMVNMAIDTKSATTTTTALIGMFGPMFDNAQLYFAGFKMALDPNNVCNPTRVMDITQFKTAGGEAVEFKPVF